MNVTHRENALAIRAIVRAGCLSAVFTLLALLGGCATVNRPLSSLNLPVEARSKNHTQASYATPPSSHAHGNGYFVGLALSGGGSRSANFSAACMFELQRLGILQKTTSISSVSGGSLAAAYYCSSRDGWNPAAVQRKLTHSFAADLIGQALLPWNLAAMALTSFDRCDLLAASFRNELFLNGTHELTFADLRADRPQLLINATQLNNGKPFVFCDESFDALNSDLSRFPLSYAVAASAAVPILLHQVTLRDYSTAFPEYHHLIDGGITDNLGVNSLIESYAQQVKLAKVNGAADPYPRGLILIVIDAHTEFDSDIDRKSDTGLLDSLTTGAGLSTTVLLNRVSSATMADLIVKYVKDDVPASELRKDLQTLETSGALVTRDIDDKPVHVIHISLSQLAALKNLPSASFGSSVNNIATYFSIEPSAAYDLYQAAHLLVTERFAAPLKQIADLLNAAATQP